LVLAICHITSCNSAECEGRTPLRGKKRLCGGRERDRERAQERKGLSSPEDLEEVSATNPHATRIFASCRYRGSLQPLYVICNVGICDGEEDEERERESERDRRANHPIIVP
jgi:hypothetical protein